MFIFNLLGKSTELTSLNTKVDTELIDEEHNDSQIQKGLICK